MLQSWSRGGQNFACAFLKAMWLPLFLIIFLCSNLNLSICMTFFTIFFTFRCAIPWLHANLSGYITCLRSTACMWRAPTTPWLQQSSRMISQRFYCTPTGYSTDCKWRTPKRWLGRRPMTRGNAQFLRNDRSVASLSVLLLRISRLSSHACFLRKYRAPIEIMMNYPRALTSAFLIFTISTVSALQALSLPTNSALSGLPTIVTVLGWTYRGCYTDSADSRTLTGENWTGSLTPSRCASICSGYRYLALESSNEWVLYCWHDQL